MMRASPKVSSVSRAGPVRARTRPPATWIGAMRTWRWEPSRPTTVRSTSVPVAAASRSTSAIVDGDSVSGSSLPERREEI